MTEKLQFASDYQEGAHPAILKELERTNLFSSPGYGFDEFTMEAIQRIQKACGCPNADIHFLIGGTQANMVVIDAILTSYQGVICAASGHINVHEAGAIEATGHKVLALEENEGKITAEQIEKYVKDFEFDANRDHMVMPGMVYLSQPTEYGTLYSKKELTAISEVCHHNHMSLYIDGARLAYALASSENDVSLSDLASLCDAFYIGGTKCGALFGEAVVIPDPDRIPHFFTIIKSHGALLAKGRIAGIQFNELFKNNLYMTIGRKADEQAAHIKEALVQNGFKPLYQSPTNQIFFIIEDRLMEKLGEKIAYNYGEKYDENHSIIRFATSWATTDQAVDALIQIIRNLKKS